MEGQTVENIFATVALTELQPLHTEVEYKLEENRDIDSIHSISGQEFLYATIAILDPDAYANLGGPPPKEFDPVYVSAALKEYRGVHKWTSKFSALREYAANYPKCICKLGRILHTSNPTFLQVIEMLGLWMRHAIECRNPVCAS